MKAHPSEQLRLLDLQAIDTRLAQIDHRLRALPEQSELAVVQGGLREIDDELELARAARADAERRHEAVARDLAAVVARLERNRARVEAGDGSPAELRSVGFENDALERRRAVLEAEAAERSSRAAGHAADVARVEARRAEMAPAEADLIARRDDALRALAAERDEALAARPAVEADIPDALLALYERARGQGAGMGAAALEGSRCGGCRLQLGPEDLRRLAAAPVDEVTRCEECRRILVRVPQADPAAGAPAPAQPKGA